jgi:hypothetical protein
MSAKNAAMGLTYLMVWQNTDMALNLKDTFQSEFTIIELINALKDIEFHKKRAESKSLKKIEFKTSEINELEISRQIDFDIPVAAQKIVSNPISLNENWNFTSQDLIKIQLRAQATQLLSKVIGGAGSFLGGFMGGGGGGPQPLGMMGGAGFGTAADGGHISGPTLVGENGPEIFIPQRSGTVIPNQQLSSVGNNQPQVVYNGPVIQNMSAIDTQSGLQFLAKNKNAVWSANQSASRGMPASRS